MKHYVVPKGTWMYVSHDEMGDTWDHEQPRRGSNQFQSVREVEYTEIEYRGRGAKWPSILIFYIGETEWGEYLVVGESQVKIIDE